MMNKHHPAHCQQSSLHTTATKNIDFRHCLITCHPKINHFIRNILNVLSPRLGYWIIFYSQHRFLYRLQLLQKTKGYNSSELFPSSSIHVLYMFIQNKAQSLWFCFLFFIKFSFKFSTHKIYILSSWIFW